MLITFDESHKTFQAKTRYEERQAIRSAGGFRWNPDKKVWWTQFIDGPLNLIDYLDEGATTHLIHTVGQKIDAITASTMADSDYEIPVRNGLAYRPFQKAGVAFTQERTDGRTLIADEMGLGKTIQALGYLNLHPEFKRVLVICPASLKRNWEREANKWLVNHTTMKIMKGRDGSKGDCPSENPNREMCIINYDLLHWRMEDLYRSWDCIIIDECHKVKNPKAKRTEAFLTIANLAKHLLALTGTPILNRPIELWNIINLLDPKTFNSERRFKNRYCWNPATRTYTGAQNLEELQEKLRETIMIRRFKKQVLTELPDKQYTVIEVEPTEKLKKLDEELKSKIDKDKLDAALNAPTLDDFIKEHHLEEGDSGEKNFSFFQLFAEQVEFGLISKFRHEAALAKISTAVNYVEDLLETTDKVIVFAHHRKVQEALRKKFKNSAYVTGGMSDDKKDDQVLKFQNDPECNVFVGSIKAASEGITLTEASEVVMIEMDWTPAAMQQAEDRAHRMGQKDMVNCHYLVTGGIEGWIAQLVAEKEEVISAAVGSGEDLDPRLEDLKEKLRKLNKHLARAKDVAREEERQKSRARKQREERKRKAWAEAGITEEKMKAAQQMCRFLAGRCDGAVKEDFAGFNGCDTRFGHSLAAQDDWTTRQYTSAVKMMRKYKRQIPEPLYNIVYGG